MDADEPGPLLNETMYREIIRSLLYLTVSIPNIVFSVGMCASFQAYPKESHFKAAKRILRYFKKIRDLVLFCPFGDNFDLIGYVDTDYERYLVEDIDVDVAAAITRNKNKQQENILGEILDVLVEAIRLVRDKEPSLEFSQEVKKFAEKSKERLTEEVEMMMVALTTKDAEISLFKHLDLLEDNNARFQIKMIYDLLKCNFIYGNKDKMDEVWINYCGMPVCFSWEEFAIVTGLKYYPPSPSQFIPIITQKGTRTPKKGKGKSSDGDDLVSLVGPSFKNKTLIEALNDKRLKEAQTIIVLGLVINRIKKKLFGATTITRKIILEGGLVVVDGVSCDGVIGGGSGSGSSCGSGAAIGANDTPLIIFERTNHYYYDYYYIGYTNFSLPSEYFACKYQECKTKRDGVINVINELIASVKELISKRGVILSKSILYPYTPLDIKVAKRRRKEIPRHHQA
ncbi:hypothetical protein BC332_13556 [Capsicum chinense]|nr:hypothetical protein BC332_13556 [Capsicum chinense]